MTPAMEWALLQAPQSEIVENDLCPREVAARVAGAASDGEVQSDRP